MPMMRVGGCRAIIFLGGSLNHVDCFNGRGDEYVFDTDVHGGSWQGSGTHILSPERCRPYGARFLRPGGVFGIEGSLFRVAPSPRLRLGTFNGRRPSRESLVGNGAGAP